MCPNSTAIFATIKNSFQSAYFTTIGNSNFTAINIPIIYSIWYSVYITYFDTLCTANDATFYNPKLSTYTFSQYDAFFTTIIMSFFVSIKSSLNHSVITTIEISFVSAF